MNTRRRAAAQLVSVLVTCAAIAACASAPDGVPAAKPPAGGSFGRARSGPSSLSAVHGRSGAVASSPKITLRPVTAT